MVTEAARVDAANKKAAQDAELTRLKAEEDARLAEKRTGLAKG